MEQCGSWNRYLPLVEFTYNNSYHASISMAPYEALYRQKCQSSLCWYEAGETSLLGPDLVRQTTEQIKRIQGKKLTTQSRQKSYADTRRKLIEFQEEDHVFLKVTPTIGVGKAIKLKKLSPWFISPF